jgi:DNA-binding NarL/FixJ family response regulator
MAETRSLPNLEGAASARIAMMPAPAATAAGRIRVMLVDDHAMVRAGLGWVVRAHPGMALVAEVSTTEAVGAATELQPDVAVLVVREPADDYVDLLSRVAVLVGRMVLVMSRPDAALERRALDAGAHGIVAQHQSASVLLSAIQHVHQGKLWIRRAPMMTDGDAADSERLKIATLTRREREIVQLVTEGLDNAQIGERLFISPATVRNHLYSIFGKLHVDHRLQLAVYAFRHHLARPA